MKRAYSYLLKGSLVSCVFFLMMYGAYNVPDETRGTDSFNYTVVQQLEEPSPPCENLDIVETLDPLEEHTCGQYIELSDQELRDFAALVTLEARGCSEECQKWVASTILNRMTVYGQSFDQVAYAPNQFSPAHLIPETSPIETAVSCVKQVAESGPVIPEYVCYFRSHYYFDWGDRYCNYGNIDNMYFSYDSLLKSRLEAQ